MLRVSLFGLLLAPALAVQVPIQLGPDLLQQKEEKGILVSDESHTEWDLRKLPHPDDTDNLVFETVYSLLQHWPNTRMRNGHNIIPGIVPKGTLFYHGSNVDTVPDKPDWIATDPEHAYIFCRESAPPATFAPQDPHGCWHLTLVTTRPLKIVYFDGSGGAKLPNGSLDTQDLLAWGELSPGSVITEQGRIKKLCEWGKKFDVDAFVRMELNFEAMLCDFTSGVSVLSTANLVNRNSMPSLSPAIVFEAINSGTWRNRFPGEPRVKLDLSGLISFYDTKLVPSLVPVRADQERWDHRAGNASSDDWAAVKARLEATLLRPSSQSSGFDWRTLFQVIVDRYAGRLELTRHLLDSLAAQPDQILDLAIKTHTQLRIMLTPYILLSVKPTDPLDKTDLDWTTPVYKFCATIHTEFLESEWDSMTDSERLLLRALRGTNQEICRVVTNMWAAGVHAGLDPSLNTNESPDIVEISHVSRKWAADLNRLMGWLDWSVWVKCNPECGPEEMCYLSTWPYGFPRSEGQPKQHPMPDGSERPLDDWVRPQPRCVPRVTPYEPFFG